MKKLIIVATIIAKPNKEAFVKEELLKLIDPTIKEEGCIEYTLHQDNNEFNKFLFYEKWENRELWQKHMHNNHLVEYEKAIEKEDAVDKFIVQEMSIIS